MSGIAALIRAMAAAGAPPEAIALAVDAIEAAQQQIDAKRAIERDRKRRQRDRDKGGTVTGQSRDSHGDVPPEPPLPPSPLPSPPNPLNQPPLPPTPPLGEGAAPPEKPSIVKGGGSISIPPWVPRAEWDDYVAMRRASKAAFTVGAAKGIIKRLAQFQDDGEPIASILEKSTRNGWLDVFSLKDKRDGQLSHPRNGQPDRLNPLATAALDPVAGAGRTGMAGYGKDTGVRAG